MKNRSKTVAPREAEALKKKKLGGWEHWHWIMLMLIAYDVAVTNGAYLFALWIRFDCTFSRIEPQYLTAWQNFIPIYTACCVVVFWVLHLYQSIWRFVSFNEFKRVLVANVVTVLFHTAVITIAFARMPISYYVIGMGTQFLFTLGIRFAYRFVLLERRKWNGSRKTCQPGYADRCRCSRADDYAGYARVCAYQRAGLLHY